MFGRKQICAGGLSGKTTLVNADALVGRVNRKNKKKKKEKEVFQEARRRRESLKSFREIVSNASSSSPSMAEQTSEQVPAPTNSNRQEILGHIGEGAYGVVV